MSAADGENAAGHEGGDGGDGGGFGGVSGGGDGGGDGPRRVHERKHIFIQGALQNCAFCKASRCDMLTCSPPYFESYGGENFFFFFFGFPKKKKKKISGDGGAKIRAWTCHMSQPPPPL